MELTRRASFAVCSGTLVAVSLSGLSAHASLADGAILTLIGDEKVEEGGVTLTVPEVAENGNMVPIGFDAPGSVEVTLLADGNPAPNIATFKFGFLSG